MNLQQIKAAVEKGVEVFVGNEGYKVVKDSLGQYFIKCTANGYCIGLTWQDGVTPNFQEANVFTSQER
jgi:GH43 family beta-xylosidase